MTFQQRIFGLLFVIAIAFVGSGCERREVQERFVEKGVELPPEKWWSGSRPAPAARSAQAATPGWRVPEGWRRSAEEVPMRVATFLAPAGEAPVEIAVTRFAGDVGGELANVNRWRGQLGLAPLDENELNEAIERFGSLGFTGYLARIDAGAQTLVAVGVHDEAADHTWFVRATDTPERLDLVADELIAFARSIAESGEGGTP